MPRPKIRRMIQSAPMVRYFKPQGVPLRFLREETLPLEGLEAIRLADVEGMEHEAAGVLMGISRPTFTRVLAAARAVVGRALVHGWAIRVEGGDFHLADENRSTSDECRGAGHGGRRRRSGRG